MFKLHLMAFAVLGTLAGLSSTTAQTPPDGKRPDLVRAPLEGTYTIVSGEKNGQAIPADHFKNSVVRITGDVMTGTDREKKEFFACTYVLLNKREPWSLDMKSTSPKEGIDAFGLVKKDGDSLTIIYSLPGGEKPTEFKTKDNQHLFVLKATQAGN